jgi:hypothetical protein
MSKGTKGMFEIMKQFVEMNASPSPGTAAQAMSSVINNNITQNNELNFMNHFHGDRAGQEKSAAAMDKAADDVTGKMARALLFAKG